MVSLYWSYFFVIKQEPLVFLPQLQFYTILPNHLDTFLPSFNPFFTLYNYHK